MEFKITLDTATLYILISFLVAIICYAIGSINSIKDDIKTIEYDKLKKDYNQLKDTIKIIKKNEK